MTDDELRIIAFLEASAAARPAEFPDWMLALLEGDRAEEMGPELIAAASLLYARRLRPGIGLDAARTLMTEYAADPARLAELSERFAAFRLACCFERLKRAGRFEEVYIDDPFDPDGDVSVRVTEARWQSANRESPPGTPRPAGISWPPGRARAADRRHGARHLGLRDRPGPPGDRRWRCRHRPPCPGGATAPRCARRAYPRHDRHGRASGGLVLALRVHVTPALSPIIKVDGARRLEDLPATAEPGEPGEEDLIRHGAPVPAYQSSVDAQALHRLLTQVQGLAGRLGDRRPGATKRLGALAPRRTRDSMSRIPAD
jgi:hypothetical protein